MSAEAPDVRLDIVRWRDPARTTDDLAGAPDAAICCAADALTRFHRQQLYADRDVLSVRRGHPIGAGLSHRDRFLAARHVAVVGAERTVNMTCVELWVRECA